MALGTTPSVEGARERLRAIGSAATFTIGAVLGGAALAAVVSFLAGLAGVRDYALVAAAIVAAVYGVPAIFGRPLVLRGRHWQVPKSWFAHTSMGGFLAAGFTLALGIFTPIRYATFLVWLACIAALPIDYAVAIGVLYGVVRSIENWRNAFGKPSLGIENPQQLATRNVIYGRLVNLSLVVVPVVALVGYATMGAARSSSRNLGWPAPAIAPGFEVVGTNPSLTQHCRPAKAKDVIASALRAFNRGQSESFSRVFTTAANFAPYNGVAHLYGGSASTFVRARNEAGDGWSARRLLVPKTGSGWAIFGVEVQISSFGDVRRTAGVKVVLVCQSGRIRQWIGPPWPP